MTHLDFLALRLFNELNVLYANNRKGRYDKQIIEKQKELDEVLSRLELKEAIA